MKNYRLFAALFLALPFAAVAQTKPTTSPTTSPKPGTQQVTEVTEELDPATGKVIRRTTRTTTVPAGTPRPAPRLPAPTATATSEGGMASDSQVSDFFREKIAVGSLTAPECWPPTAASSTRCGPTARLEAGRLDRRRRRDEQPQQPLRPASRQLLARRQADHSLACRPNFRPCAPPARFPSRYRISCKPSSLISQ